MTDNPVTDNPDPAGTGTPPPVKSRLRHLRSLEFLPARSRVTNTVIILAIFSLAAFGLYRLTLPRYLESARANDSNLRQQIQDGMQLATIHTNLQFCVLVRQDSSGTLNLRCLSAPAPPPSDTAQNRQPTMIVALYCQVLRGVDARDLMAAVKINESAIYVHLPTVQLNVTGPDTAATRVIYRSGGTFLYTEEAILARVYQNCRQYANTLASADTLQTKAAGDHGRSVLEFIAEHAGKKLIFE